MTSTIYAATQVETERDWSLSTQAGFWAPEFMVRRAVQFGCTYEIEVDGRLYSVEPDDVYVTDGAARYAINHFAFIRLANECKL